MTKMVVGVLHRQVFLVVVPMNCGLRLLVVDRVNVMALTGRHTLLTMALLPSHWMAMDTPSSKIRLPLI